jgi:hypothetical protein
VTNSSGTKRYSTWTALLPVAFIAPAYQVSSTTKSFAGMNSWGRRRWGRVRVSLGGIDDGGGQEQSGGRDDPLTTGHRPVKT